MHRLAPDDLSATLPGGSDTWTTVKLPLIAEKTEGPYTYNGRVIHHRHVGEPLNVNRMSVKDVESLKASLPAHVWDGQYQQRPTIGASGMLDISWFKRYKKQDIPTFEHILHSWDIGATVTGDASVCTV